VKPGRSCPAGYGYPASVFQRVDFKVETLWVAGGLYGNPFALARLLELYEREPGSKALVFNGDFHWFDIEDFGAIERVVERHRGTRGNVETEIATPAQGAGCGCGYPDWVDDGTVERSNRILERLRQAAPVAARARLAALPMHLVAELDGERVAIVHGDAGSLAGWGFSQEVLATPPGREAAQAAFDAGQVRIFASSHTCLPVMARFPGERVLVNNGAAGMPNFRGTTFGLATRISLSAGKSLYAQRAGRLFVEAIALDYDAAAWQRHFLAQWPAGSDAHESYYRRMVSGPGCSVQEALAAAA
jgi:hypothetical protein